MLRTDSLEKTLMLVKIEVRRRRGRQRMRWLEGITDSMDMSLSDSGSWWWTGRPGELQSMWSQRVGHDWATELNWTELICFWKADKKNSFQQETETCEFSTYFLKCTLPRWRFIFSKLPSSQDWTHIIDWSLCQYEVISTGRRLK